MSFRTRLVAVVTCLTVVTLGSAFFTVFVVMNREQERQLDRALHAEAVEEAGEAASIGGNRLAISDGPGPTADDVGPLTKYGAIYDPSGAVLAQTTTFGNRPPVLAVIQHAPGECFNLRSAQEHLRGVLVPIPGHVGSQLFLAAPRTDLDGDQAFLRRAMTAVFGVAVLWAALVAFWIIQRITRGHNAIVAVAHRVVAGDLSARIGPRPGDPEIFQLACDIDEMIHRLDTLIGSQQRFIAHAAHELRSPVATLYGELSHALRRPRDAEGYRTAIDEALDSTRRLKLLIEDLLALARLEARRNEPDETLSVGDWVREAVTEVEPMARTREVSIAVAAGDAAVLGRPHDVVRMLRNLLENAIWHSPRGSRVQVDVTQSGGRVGIIVSDQGPGITADERERIFEPFFRGRRELASEIPGAGLGLTIAREIAVAHGGEISLESPDVAAGARFAVYLPMATDPTAS